MCPLQIISYLVEEHEGDQAGEVLASFIVHKQAELTFLTEFGGIEHFLQEQVKLYEGSQPSCARELNIVKAAVKEVAKITQALVMQQRPRMNFGTPGAAVRPAMNFGEAGPSGLQQPGSAPAAHAAQGLHMPPGRGEAYSLALPPRWGDGIADSAGSRSDIRDGMARLANTQRTAAAEHASAHPPPPSSLVRRGSEHGRRGEMLEPQHVAEELARVQRRILTQQLRDDSASEGEVDDEELGLPMRGAADWDQVEMPRLDRGWQHLSPVADSEHWKLHGWPICAVFPTGGRGELRWHYGGFVFDTARTPLRGGGGWDLRVRAVFPDGFEDWWSELPDPAFAFESQGQCVPAQRVEAARRRFGM